MYCIKCGVELADSEKRCPLCEMCIRDRRTGSGDGLLLLRATGGQRAERREYDDKNFDSFHKKPLVCPNL